MAMATEASLLPDEDLQGFDEFLYSQAAFVEMDKTGNLGVGDNGAVSLGGGLGRAFPGIIVHLEFRDEFLLGPLVLWGGKGW